MAGAQKQFPRPEPWKTEAVLSQLAALLGISDKDLSTTPSNDAAELQKSAAEKFPFLKFAVQSLLFHADVAEGAGIYQANFLNNFRPYQWVRFHDLFEIY